MDSVIAVLPSEVIDQIAAGEVIERPASVVKELVDNAIDAGAKTIAIETAAGGRALVRVVDDGCGMSARDAVLALERHATSKLRRLDDLWGIATLGFRGEALPSIASVSRLTLTTRRTGDLAATRVTMTGGRLDEVTEVGGPVGTCVEVADLLWNVPARLKFLKADATEAGHVTELAARVAMAHPELHVRLRHDGRVALEAPPDRDGFSRAHALLGARVAARLVSAGGEEAGVRVIAYLGAPELAQTTARAVQLFVGRRPVRDRGLLHAVAMGYGELVPRGRYPIAIVHVDAPAGVVDFNVHPQKLEVRFSDASAVAAAVRHVVAAGVARAPWRDEVGGAIAWTSVAPPALPSDGDATPLAQRYAAQLRDAREREWTRQGKLGLDDDGAREWVRGVKSAARAAEGTSDLGPRTADRDRDPKSEVRSPKSEVPFFSALRYLGQLDLTYLVCETDGELVLIDQHVAHERVELARMQAQGARAVATQRLLFPATVEAEPRHVALAEQLAGVLAQVGYEVEAFGKTTLAIKAVPGGLRHGDPAELLRALLAKWAEAGAPREQELVERALAEIACHSVVRAGDRLTASEAEALLRQMDDVDFRAKGPHDRPALLRLPIAELARRFGR
jgi:DNA mismatch repair protein MutL